MTHVVNLVVHSILAALGETNKPEDIPVDYFLLEKAQPFHLKINNDPD